MKKLTPFLTVLIAGGVHISGLREASAADITVTADISANTTWSADNVYILRQSVFVTNDATLTIQPGTTILGGQDLINGTFGSLIITRGSKIMAEGTADEPIVFTAEDSRTRELTLEDSSLWGGLIILGKAILNDADNPVINPSNPVLNEREIEGFPSGGNDDNIKYGGLDDDDNSGVLRFVSIRNGGFEFQQDEEINGLTLGAVGRGTTIEYVEVFNNSDDGVEFFGGTVNTRYMVMAFNEDESFDIDQGYRGTNQFWFAIQKNVGKGSNYAGEHDGGDSPNKVLEPFARSQVYNATFIGAGAGSANAQENYVFRLKDNWAGSYFNSVFTDFQGGAIRVDADPGIAADANLSNNTFGALGADPLKNNSAAEQSLLAGNDQEDPSLRCIGRAPNSGLDPRPAIDSPLWSNELAETNDPFVTPVGYRGAFGDENWAKGWTALDEFGYFDEIPTPTGADVVVDADITTDTTWTADKVYILRKSVFVTSGATLTIEPGTTILGGQDLINGTFGSLIITRGSKIMAEGTQARPIIFTAEDSRTRELTLEDSSLWGGLIILGRAILNDADNPIINPSNPVLNEREIEGFPSGGNDDNIKYGGLDDDDNSGVLRFVSIRNGGFEFQQDEEINGLTLGAVGRGTTIEYVEVFNNSDDGVEFFGGTVNTRYMVMAFNEDESFDIDQGYRGTNQFWFAIQKNVGKGSNYAGEHDGGDSPNKVLEPFARSQVYNATFIGAGAGSANAQENFVFRLKDNWAGSYFNSVFTDFQGGAIRVDADPGIATDANLSNNTFGILGADPLKNNSAAEQALLAGNDQEDPRLLGIGRTPSGGLDPRPAVDSPLWHSNMKEAPDSVDSVSYRGAFGERNWALGWTALDEFGYFDQAAPVATTDVVVTADISTNTTWTADNAYILRQTVFVTNGATLTIEPGTTIYGGQDLINGTFGSLVITRGSKIMAEGTQTAPIVFEAEDARTRTLTLEDSSLWGGVIILGRAILNDADNPVINPSNPVLNEREIEGFPSGGNDDNIKYGGLDDDDNSGVMRFVSIRNGGFEFQQDEEINGLTLGAVGRGTTIEFIEVFNNSDDGVEFFGGTVDTRYMVMAFNEDESFDIDQGYRGRNQFWFAVQKNVGKGSNYAGEHDGGDSPNKVLEPFARSQVYNATFIGAGAGSANAQENYVFRLKDNWAGSYFNSVFTDFQGGAIRVDADPGVAVDATLVNNTFGLLGADPLKNNSAAEQALLAGNDQEDPLLRGISRTIGGEGLDPRPLSNSPLWTASRSALPTGDFYREANYRGAFGARNWLKGWTQLDQSGILADIFSPVPVIVPPTDESLFAVFPTVTGFSAENKAQVGFAVKSEATYTVYIASDLNFTTEATEGTDYSQEATDNGDGTTTIVLTILKDGAEQYLQVRAQ